MVEPEPRGNRLDRKYSNSSTKQMSYLIDMNSAIYAGPDKACQESYARAICEPCGSKSLHALYIGYSFVEWICDICGARNETSSNNSEYLSRR